MLASETFSADEARMSVRTLQAHEREQLREAGKRKMNELRSLKAAVVQAHAAAKLLQQQNTSQAQSAGVLGSPRASCAAGSMQKQQQGHPVTTQPQQHATAVPREQAESASSQVSGPITTSSSADTTKGHTPGLGTTAMSDNSSRAASTGFRQPSSSSSAVAAAASAVAAGAAAVAANAAARAAAAAPSGPWADTTPAAAAVVPLQPAPSLQRQEQQQQQQQQQQQNEQNAEGQSPDVSAVDEVSVQDPMVDMLLLQVEALMSEKQQLAAKCCGLERENEQLAELVGHLHDTLETTVDQQEQQQQQGAPRLTIPSFDQQQLQQQTILEDDAEGVDDDGGSRSDSIDVAAAAAAADDVVCDPMLSQSHSPTSTQEGLDVDGDQLMATAHLTQHDTAPDHTMTPAVDTAPVTDTAPAGPAAQPGAVEAAAMTPFVAAAAVPAAAGPEEMFLAKQKQMRVAEWLAHRAHEAVSSNSAAAAGAAPPPSLSWQRWQEQLPLEAMSSGSSSTLTITLADA